MTNDSPRRKIQIIAAVIRDEAGRCLLVRKAGTSCFMQAGGKPLAGEAPLDTLEREIIEELGCSIDRESAEFFGEFHAEAANEIDSLVEASVYRISLRGAPDPQGEIEEMIWLDPRAVDQVELAPLTRDCILPHFQNWVKRTRVNVRDVHAAVG